jgi:hypothetical protein
MSAYTPTVFTRLCVTAWGRIRMSTPRKMDLGRAHSHRELLVLEFHRLLELLA